VTDLRDHGALLVLSDIVMYGTAYLNGLIDSSCHLVWCSMVAAVGHAVSVLTCTVTVQMKMRDYFEEVYMIEWINQV
jgi:hypothetical protein